MDMKIVWFLQSTPLDEWHRYSKVLTPSDQESVELMLLFCSKKEGKQDTQNYLIWTPKPRE